MAASKAAAASPDNAIDIDAEIAADAAAAASPVDNVQPDGTVWFSVGVGMINVTTTSTVYERLTAEGIKPVPAPEVG